MDFFDRDFKEKDNLDLAMDDMDVSGDIDIDGMSPEELAEMGIELDDLDIECTYDEVDYDDESEVEYDDLDELVDGIDEFEDEDLGEDDEQN